MTEPSKMAREAADSLSYFVDEARQRPEGYSDQEVYAIFATFEAAIRTDAIAKEREACRNTVLSWTPEKGPIAEHTGESPAYWERRCIALAIRNRSEDHG